MTTNRQNPQPNHSVTDQKALTLEERMTRLEGQFSEWLLFHRRSRLQAALAKTKVLGQSKPIQLDALHQMLEEERRGDLQEVYLASKLIGLRKRSKRKVNRMKNTAVRAQENGSRPRRIFEP